MSLEDDVQEMDSKPAKVRDGEKFLAEFIEIYQTYPCLWKYSCKDYRNRFVKDRAYAALAKKMREVDPRADKNSVIRKINALRTAFRREYKKMRKSKAALCSGQSKKRYMTSLWYYDLLKFVVDEQDFVEISAGSPIGDWPDASDNYVSLDDGKIVDSNSQTFMDYLEDTPSMHQTVVKVESTSPVSSRAASPVNVSGPSLSLEIDAVYSEKFNNSGTSSRRDDVVHIQEPPALTPLWKSKRQQHSTTMPAHLESENSDLDRFGSYVAMKLKRSTRKQSIIAEKVIAEVLMRANLGTLEETTMLTDIKMEQQLL